MRQLISSHDIDTLFASTRRDAQELLPHLVRRLIRASCHASALVQVQMAAGDDIASYGWDGLVQHDATHPFVPMGVSGWEIGVSGDPADKATRDYAKRTADPLLLVPQESTFVFVTPRMWPGKQTWLSNKRADSPWKAIRVVDGADLAAWLEEFPAIGRWLCEELGRSVTGLETVTAAWNKLARFTYCDTVTPGLVVGGRTAIADKLIAWLRDPTSEIDVIGETQDEAILFALATCKICSADQGDDWLDRFLVLSSAEGAGHLQPGSRPHIGLLTDPTLFPTIRSSVQSGLSLIVPCGRETRARRSKQSLELGLVTRRGVRDALVQSQMPERDADEIARESRGSLCSMLPLLAGAEAEAVPWASGEVARSLLPLVLACRWDDRSDADRSIVESLAQRLYAEIESTARVWSAPAKPLEWTNGVWRWRSWRYAWEILTRNLDAGSFERMLVACETVLAEEDPALHLPPGERWLARIRGAKRGHSDELRSGLADSLAMFGSRGSMVPMQSVQYRVDQLVRRVLATDERASRWKSLEALLPTLAEASPDGLLDALDGLVANPKARQEVFRDEGMLAGPSHIGVLWALERLAWSREHFAKVVQTLARLAAIDPGGTWVNRPKETLRTIFLPWCPGTRAPLKDRIDALRLLFVTDHSVGWQCAISLLPSDHDMCSELSKPEWREWVVEPVQAVSVAEYWQYQEAILEMLLSHLSGVARWVELLETIPTLVKSAPALARDVFQAARQLDRSALSESDVKSLYEAVNALIVRHESCPGADWSMTGAELDEYRQVRGLFTPRRRRDRDAWLFEPSPHIPGDAEMNWEAASQALATLRQESVKGVMAEEGLTGVLEWCNEVSAPDTLGVALSEVLTDEDEIIAAMQFAFQSVGVIGDRPPNAQFAWGFAAARSQGDWESWFQFARAKVPALEEPRALAYFAQTKQPCLALWTWVEAASQAAMDVYWRESAFWYVPSLDDGEVAVRELLSHGRPFAAIHVASMLVYAAERQTSDADSLNQLRALVTQTLAAQPEHLPAEETPPVHTGNVCHDVDKLLAFLDTDDERLLEVARLEWKWLPFASHGRRTLSALQRAMARAPELFVELLKVLYRSDANESSEVEPLSDLDKERAHRAFKVLEAWAVVPGSHSPRSSDTRATGKQQKVDQQRATPQTLDADRLREWVDTARKLAAECGRSKPCEDRIGHVLAHAPADDDGVWPHIAVRDLIESSKSEHLERCFYIGILNKRGAHFTARDGEPERALARQYRSWHEAVRLTHPRTAKLLQQIADTYESDAQREIEERRAEEFER